MFEIFKTGDHSLSDVVMDDCEMECTIPPVDRPISYTDLTAPAPVMRYAVLEDNGGYYHLAAFADGCCIMVYSYYDPYLDCAALAARDFRDLVSGEISLDCFPWDSGRSLHPVTDWLSLSMGLISGANHYVLDSEG